MAAGGSIGCRVGSLPALFCKTDANLLLVQLAAAGLDKLNDITVRHDPSMPDSARVTSGYKTDQKDTFHQLAEVNSLFGAGVSLCRPCGACAQFAFSTLPSAVHAVTACLCRDGLQYFQHLPVGPPFGSTSCPGASHNSLPPAAY